MTTRSTGDDAQIRAMLDQMGDAVITRFVAQHPELKKPEAEIPAPLKWAGGILAALFTAGICGLAFWIVTTLSDVQVTVARMEERMALQDSNQGGRFAEIERRVANLESFHRGGGQ